MALMSVKARRLSRVWRFAPEIGVKSAAFVGDDDASLSLAIMGLPQYSLHPTSKRRHFDDRVIRHAGAGAYDVGRNSGCFTADLITSATFMKDS